VPDGIKNDYESVCLLARGIGARVIPMDYITKNLETDELGAEIPPYEDYIQTLPLFLTSIYDADELLYDEVHLTAEGNKILAKTICAYLFSHGFLEGHAHD